MSVILYWILLGVLGFGFALAVQMRVMIALVLRRALNAWREGFAQRATADAVIINAAGWSDGAGDQLHNQAVAHLRETYPLPLSHLRTARRASIAFPIAILAWLALGRFAFGMF